MAALPRPHRLFDPHGRFLAALLWHDASDRLRGERRRARARWGGVDRPSSQGKLVWIVAGASRESVRLAADIAAAILDHRLDLSVALTYEAEHPDLLAAIDFHPRIACGYGPADYVGAMQKAWRRLLPFAMVLAGIVPRPNLVRLCEACRHPVLVSPPGFALGRYERIYPGHRQIYEGRHVFAAADLSVLQQPATPPDDRHVRGITGGRPAYLWHGSDVNVATRLYALFRGHLPQSVMLAAGPVVAGLRHHSRETVCTSTWSGQPVAPDKLVLLDDPEAAALIMPDVRAVHLDLPERTLMWQALAAGAHLSGRDAEWIDAPGARARLQLAGEENALIGLWRELDADPALAAATAAEARAAHAAERALAQRAMNDLLARVSAWQ